MVFFRMPATEISAMLFQMAETWVTIPIWSVLRLVSTSPTPAGVTNLVLDFKPQSRQNDFIPMSNSNVWHSHFYLPAIGAGLEANGTTINPDTPATFATLPGSSQKLALKPAVQMFQNK